MELEDSASYDLEEVRGSGPKVPTRGILEGGENNLALANFWGLPDKRRIELSILNDPLLS